MGGKDVNGRGLAGRVGGGLIFLHRLTTGTCVI